jgi:uncharacterized protein (DUF1800 family)
MQLEESWRPAPPPGLEEFLGESALGAGRPVNPIEGFADRLSVIPLRRETGGASSGIKVDLPVPPLESLVFSRAAYGARPHDVDDFRSLGSTPRQRLESWVDWQLEPESIDDGELETRLAQSRYETLHKSLEQLWNEHLRETEDNEYRFLPIYEAQHAAMLRAIYSRRQLAEVLADFWHNHFNVHGFHFFAGPVFPHYDRDVIRAHSLGNFRTFIEAMTASPAMLFYLDNVFSSADGPNENFARELLELHTLGEENYYGAIPADEVPTTPDGVPMGYTEEDVRELARCLTGWSLDERNGEFLYRWYWHDNGPKRVLGLEIPPYQPPLEDVRNVLDLLARHPGVARFVCTKLCRRLIGDTPPASVVDAAAAVFLDTVDEPDQLRRVTRTILLSDEFAATWGDKVRRPFELVTSAVRAMGPDFNLPLGDTFSRYYFYLLYTTGNLPFTWVPPTGFPDRKEVWLTTNALVTSWRLVNLLAGVDIQGWRPCDPAAATPGHLATAEELTDYWIDRALLRSVDDASRSRIVDFMAQGAAPDAPLDLSNPAGADRLRSMVGLILLSPHFLWR